MKFIYFKVLGDDPDMRGSGLHFCNNKTLAKLRTHPHTVIEDYSCFSDQGRHRRSSVPYRSTEYKGE